MVDGKLNLINICSIWNKTWFWCFICGLGAANESFEKVASYGLTPNMILYLMKDYKMSLANGQNLLFLWSAATNFFPIFGAFLADSYLGRFLTIGFASIISFLVFLSFSLILSFLITFTILIWDGLTMNLTNTN